MGKVELSIDDLEGTMKKFNALYEPAGDDEENAYNLIVNDEMSPEDVVQKVIDIVQWFVKGKPFIIANEFIFSH